MHTKDMSDDERMEQMGIYTTVLYEFSSMSKNQFFQAISGSKTAEQGIAKALELMGESAHYMTSGARARFSDIDFGYWARWRHDLVHEYPFVQVEQIWNVIWRDVPGLHSVLESYGYIQENR